MALYDEFDRRPNRLINARSAYLREAAYQPVGWYEFTPEAFAEARRQEKPVLLDIGAAWCHWCHVIDRESYENPEIATLINEHFIPVKVDRDERPDIDARYQTAIQLLTGHGGWPLTAFLDPDGVPFYGGTYFPPEDIAGRTGFLTLLPRLAHVYKHRRHELEEVAQSLRARAEEREGIPSAGLSDELPAKILRALRTHFNRDQGGFERGGPKFPHPAAIELALLGWDVTGEEFWRVVVVKTLREMVWGGIHDQLGGGWHRYATDAGWSIPHFEKLASDNALMLENLTHACRAFDDSLLREAARGTLGFILRELTDHQRGGFYASQDADYSLHDDGDYWTWSQAEFLDALSADEVKVLVPYYGVTPRGNMPEHHRNVLRVMRTPEELVDDLELPLETVRARIASGKAALLRARGQRKTPAVDTSKYAGWNALLISALLEAGTLLEHDEALSVALRAADTLLRDAYDPDQGIYHQFHAEDGARLPGLLEDQAYAAKALLEAFGCGGQRAQLEAALRLLDLCIARYWDDDTGGFFDVAADRSGVEAAFLTSRRKTIDDLPTPAPNAVLAITLDRAWLLTHDERYRDYARRTLEAFAAEAPHYGVYAAAYGLAVSHHLRPPAAAIIVGALEEDAAQALWRAARETYRPGRLVAAFAPDAKPPYPAREGETAVAYVCVAQRCSEPKTEPEALRRALSAFGRPAHGEEAA
ncbi:MAG: Thiol:disulfide interchange protein DsbD [bacterium ADurb.Bin429]|nr:MAG: Thiol:disulfide interchange protein DsbD [bacterium ADurb.Bin429]